MSKTSVLIGIVIGVLLTVAVLGGIPGPHGGALVQPAYANAVPIAMCPFTWNSRGGEEMVTRVLVMDSAGNITSKAAPSSY